MTAGPLSGTLMSNGFADYRRPLEEGFEMKKIAAVVGGSLVAAFLASAAPAFAETPVNPQADINAPTNIAPTNIAPANIAPASTAPSLMANPSIAGSQVAGLSPSMGAPYVPYILDAQMPPIVW